MYSCLLCCFFRSFVAFLFQEYRNRVYLPASVKRNLCKHHHNYVVEIELSTCSVVDIFLYVPETDVSFNALIKKKKEFGV